MQVVFSNKKKERESIGSSPSATTSSSTPHDHVALLQSKTAPAILNMYRDPPTGEITLTEFETTAMERVQVLKLIESSLARGLNTGANRDVFIQTINTAIHKYGLNNYRKDVISHFVLRLAYCKSNELRTWFINHETQLFRVRFASLDHHAIDAFLVDAEMDFRPLESIDPEIRRKLRQLSFADQNMNEQYYKVPFEDALDLIRRRSVYLEAGFAYVSRSDLITIAAAQYRAHISRQMTATYHYVQSQRPDQRIVPIVSSISRQHVGPTYKAGRFSGTVTKDQIPLLADRSFPLCMNNLYKGLKDDNHLKHGGRMQFGLFLKGIGLSLNDALAFWKQSFARRTPPEKFDKEYAYNIRHNYGKEGKRTQYTPYSCMKIISSQPGTGDHHGCPFKHFDAEHMRSKLAERRVPRAGQDEILELVKGHHYQVACQKYYALTHHVTKVPDSVGNHPNAYFDASIRHYKELEGTPAIKQESGVPAITSSPTSSQATLSQTSSQATLSQTSIKSDTDGDVAMNTTETHSQSSAPTSSPPAAIEPMQA